MVTKEAIITTNAGIRTLSGIKFFKAEIAILEHINTNVVDNPIPKAFIAEVVVASVGHIPIKRTNIGFSFNIPLNNIFNLFMVNWELFLFFIFLKCFKSRSD